MDEYQLLRSALADIAFSEDMTLEIARAKAKRVYESTVEPTDEKGRQGEICSTCGDFVIVGRHPKQKPDAT